MARLRHSAVHRQPVTAKGVSQLLESAVKLSQILQDYRRTEKLDNVRKELDSKISAIKLHKAVLEDTAAAGLLDVQRQHDELDRREKAIIKEAVKADRQNNIFIGQFLEEHVFGTFGKGKRAWVPHGLEEQDVGYGAGGKRIEKGLRLDHGAQVNGVQENSSKNGNYYYDNL